MQMYTLNPLKPIISGSLRQQANQLLQQIKPLLNIPNHRRHGLKQAGTLSHPLNPPLLQLKGKRTMTHDSSENMTGDSQSENSHNESLNNWRRYFSFSTDHKVIGVQYMVTTFIFFLIGGLLAMLIRAELLTPASNVVDRPLYNGLFTLHGTIMIFLWIIPFNAGISNYLVPLMIGAKDMAFPLLNAIAFWMIPPSGLLLLASFFLPSGPPQSGWWSYPPVSLQ